MAVTEYIGPLVGPVFADPAEWTSTRSYEALNVVLNEGNSYTARQDVPVGIDIHNEKYWLCTGNYNAQLEAYRKEALSNLKIFDTVDAMTNSSLLKIGDIAATCGFHSSNDGGAAYYLIVENSQTNGTSAISLANGLVASLVVRPSMLVETFGAYGDGIHDDTAAIQDACSRCYEVVFSAKQYNIKQITLGQQLKKMTGNGGVLYNTKTAIANYPAGSTGQYMLYSKPSPSLRLDGIEIDGLTLNGNKCNVIVPAASKANQYAFEFGTLLKLYNYESVRLTNCTFKNSLQDGCSLVSCSNVYADNCIFSNNGITLNPLYSGKNGSVNFEGTNNHMSAMTADPSYNERVVNFVVTGCTFSDCGDEALRIDTYPNVVIEGCTFINTQQNVIESFSDRYYADEHITFSNSIVRNAGQSILVNASNDFPNVYKVNFDNIVATGIGYENAKVIDSANFIGSYCKNDEINITNCYFKTVDNSHSFKPIGAKNAVNVYNSTLITSFNNELSGIIVANDCHVDKTTFINTGLIQPITYGVNSASISNCNSQECRIHLLGINDTVENSNLVLHSNILFSLDSTGDIRICNNKVTAAQLIYIDSTFAYALIFGNDFTYDTIGYINYGSKQHFAIANTNFENTVK